MVPPGRRGHGVAISRDALYQDQGDSVSPLGNGGGKTGRNEKKQIFQITLLSGQLRSGLPFGPRSQAICRRLRGRGCANCQSLYLEIHDVIEGFG